MGTTSTTTDVSNYRPGLPDPTGIVLWPDHIELQWHTTTADDPRQVIATIRGRWIRENGLSGELRWYSHTDGNVDYVVFAPIKAEAVTS